MSWSAEKLSAGSRRLGGSEDVVHDDVAVAAHLGVEALLDLAHGNGNVTVYKTPDLAYDDLDGKSNEEIVELAKQ